VPASGPIHRDCLSRLAAMGAWYTIGLSLGLGLGLGIVLSGILGANAVGLVAALIAGAGVGALIGLGIGDAGEAIAGAIGGFLGALSAAAVVHGALRRGATRLGLAAFVAMGGLVVALLALIPAVGYLEAAVLPILAARMRGRQAARFAGLRTLAK
jgi:hypothetical protein